MKYKFNSVLPTKESAQEAIENTFEALHFGSMDDYKKLN